MNQNEMEWMDWVVRTVFKYCGSIADGESDRIVQQTMDMVLDSNTVHFRAFEEYCRILTGASLIDSNTPLESDQDVAYFTAKTFKGFCLRILERNGQINLSEFEEKLVDKIESVDMAIRRNLDRGRQDEIANLVRNSCVAIFVPAQGAGYGSQYDNRFDPRYDNRNSRGYGNRYDIRNSGYQDIRGQTRGNTYGNQVYGNQRRVPIRNGRDDGGTKSNSAFSSFLAEDDQRASGNRRRVMNDVGLENPLEQRRSEIVKEEVVDPTTVMLKRFKPTKEYPYLPAYGLFDEQLQITESGVPVITKSEPVEDDDTLGETDMDKRVHDIAMSLGAGRIPQPHVIQEVKNALISTVEKRQIDETGSVFEMVTSDGEEKKMILRKSDDKNDCIKTVVAGSKRAIGSVIHPMWINTLTNDKSLAVGGSKPFLLHEVVTVASMPDVAWETPLWNKSLTSYEACYKLLKDYFEQLSAQEAPDGGVVVQGGITTPQLWIYLNSQLTTYIQDVLRYRLGFPAFNWVSFYEYWPSMIKTIRGKSPDLVLLLESTFKEFVSTILPIDNRDRNTSQYQIAERFYRDNGLATVAEQTGIPTFIKNIGVIAVNASLPELNIGFVDNLAGVYPTDNAILYNFIGDVYQSFITNGSAPATETALLTKDGRIVWIYQGLLNKQSYLLVLSR